MVNSVILSSNSCFDESSYKVLAAALSQVAHLGGLEVTPLEMTQIGSHTQFELNLNRLGGGNAALKLIKTLEHANQEAQAQLNKIGDPFSRNELIKEISARHSLIKIINEKMSDLEPNRMQKVRAVSSKFQSIISPTDRPSTASQVDDKDMHLDRDPQKLASSLINSLYSKKPGQLGFFQLRAYQDEGLGVQVKGVHSYLLSERDKILARKSVALLAALKNGKAMEAKFLIEHQLYQLNNKLLRSIDEADISPDEREHLLEMLFMNCQDEHSLSKITDRLLDRTHSGFIDRLLLNPVGTNTIQRILHPTAKASSGRARRDFVISLIKKGLQNLDRQSTAYARCETLAVSMGDLELFNFVLAKYNVAFSRGLFHPANKGQWNEALTKFVAANPACLNDVDKRGRNIVHACALGDNEGVTAFVHDAMKLKNAQTIDHLKQNLVTLSALKEKRKLTNGQVSELRANLAGLKELLKLGRERAKWHTKQPPCSIYAYVNTLNPKSLLKNVNQMMGLLSAALTDESNSGGMASTSTIDVGLVDKIHNKISEAVNRLELDKDPFKMRDLQGVKPLHLMQISLANKVDDLYGINGNLKGSLSNAVGYYHMIARHYAVKQQFIGSLSGKYGGSVAATILLEANPGMSQIGVFFASNSLLMGALLMGFLATRCLVRAARSRISARMLGVDKTLSLYAGEPSRITRIKEVDYKGLTNQQALKLALKKRDLGEILSRVDKEDIEVSHSLVKELRDVHTFYHNGKDRRAEVLTKLALKCPNKAVAHRLLDEQLLAGHHEQVGAAIQEILRQLPTENQFTAKSSQTLQFHRKQMHDIAAACLLTAAKIGSLPSDEYSTDQVSFIEKVIKQVKAKIGSGFLLTVTHPRNGNTLLHEVCLSRDVKAFTILADELVAGTEGHQIEYVRKRGGVLSLVSENKTTLTHQNVFDTPNKDGLRIYDFMDRTFARQLDQVYRFTANATGGFNTLYQKTIDSHHFEIGAELGLVIPVKLGINIGLSGFLEALLQAAIAFADLYIPGAALAAAGARLLLVSAILCLSEFAALATGFFSTKMLSKPTGSFLTYAYYQLTGRSSQLTQFRAEGNSPKARAQVMREQTLFARRQGRIIQEVHKPFDEAGAALHRVGLLIATQKYIDFYQAEVKAGRHDFGRLAGLEVLKGEIESGRIAHAGQIPRQMQERVLAQLDGLPEEDRDGFKLCYAEETERALIAHLNKLGFTLPLGHTTTS